MKWISNFVYQTTGCYYLFFSQRDGRQYNCYKLPSHDSTEITMDAVEDVTGTTGDCGKTTGNYTRSPAEQNSHGKESPKRICCTSENQNDIVIGIAAAESRRDSETNRCESDDENEICVSSIEEVKSNHFSHLFVKEDDTNRDSFLGSVKSAFTSMMKLFRRSTSKPWHVNSNRTFEDPEEVLWKKNSDEGKNWYTIYLRSS